MVKCGRNRVEIAAGVFADALADAVIEVFKFRFHRRGSAKLLEQAEPSAVSAVSADEPTAEHFAGLPVREAWIWRWE